MIFNIPVGVTERFTIITLLFAIKIHWKITSETFPADLYLVINYIHFLYYTHLTNSCLLSTGCLGRGVRVVTRIKFRNLVPWFFSLYNFWRLLIFYSILYPGWIYQIVILIFVNHTSSSFKIQNLILAPTPRNQVVAP